MTLAETLSHLLPLIVAVVLIGGAMAGSLLRAGTRAVVERWVVWPVFALAAGAYAIQSLMHDEPIRAGIGAVVIVMAAFYLVRNIKRQRAASAQEHPTGTGTTA